MAKLVMHRNILKNYSKFPLVVQKRLSEFVADFQSDPTDPRLRLHPLTPMMRDHKVRGADLPAAYRAIIIAPEQGDTYLLVHIDKHDDAYRWAANKLFEVHPSTGTFQIVNVEESEQVVPRREVQASAGPVYPLASIGEEELFRAGVPRALVPAVRRVVSDEMLDALAPYLPPDCRDVLYGIAAGLDVDAAVEEMFGKSLDVEKPAAEPAGLGDFRNFLSSRNYDLVLVAGEEELQRVLQASIEEWRIFLHPLQRKLVEWKTRGPMCITGAAGTGKTVALMHRAAHLAKGKGIGAPPSVLITTFTSNLAITIKDQIQRLVPDGAGRVEIANLHRLARTVCQRAGWTGEVATPEQLDAIWESMKELDLPSGLGWSREEIRREYEIVVDPFGIYDEETYLTTVRTGRPRLTRELRKALWKVFAEFRRRLRTRLLETEDGLIHEARLALLAGKGLKFDHVLVDEVQDFGLEALRLIAILARLEDERADPLCLVGDGHQRVHQAKVPLGRAGINVRGRSRRLKINYRTTEEIRQFAHRRLHGLPIDDLDGGAASIVGDRSSYHGPSPEIVHCGHPAEEGARIVDWVRHLVTQENVKPHEICVTASSDAIRAALVQAKIQVYELKPNLSDPGGLEPGVRFGSRKRIKGLEYRAVALTSSTEEANAEVAESTESRCEWYVAATRAREFLLVTVLD